MSAARTLAEAWDAELVELPIDISAEDLAQAKRLFFRGALATLGMPPEQLRAELIAHGRSVGSAAEKAPRVDDRAVALMRRRA